MTKLRDLRRLAILAIVVVLPLAVAWRARSGTIEQDDASGQLSAPPGAPNGMPGAGLGHQERNPEVEQMERRQAEARNDERQKQLVKDTDKLFALASELHDEVSKTNKDMLSIEVIKKADEIQKLAKSVRDKMKAD